MKPFIEALEFFLTTAVNESIVMLQRYSYLLPTKFLSAGCPNFVTWLIKNIIAV